MLDMCNFQKLISSYITAFAETLVPLLVGHVSSVIVDF